jgi:hypothetical protein
MSATCQSWEVKLTVMGEQRVVKLTVMGEERVVKLTVMGEERVVKLTVMGEERVVKLTVWHGTWLYTSQEPILSLPHYIPWISNTEFLFLYRHGDTDKIRSN